MADESEKWGSLRSEDRAAGGPGRGTALAMVVLSALTVLFAALAVWSLAV